jgi:proteasome lid subunit RPN8/RPN11
MLAISCPKFPAAWTSELRAAARDHAAEVYPHEAAGVVAGGEYVRLDNLSETPTHDVVLDDKALLRVAQADVFFHSHPDGLGCPSGDDMRYQEQLGVPFVVMTWPMGDEFCFGAMLEKAPLIGRAFRHGVHDCYSIMRDWYELQGVTDIPDQPRDWEWWTKGERHYLDGFKRCGFGLIERDAATRTGDVILFSFNNATPMHGALVHDPQLLLHHIGGPKPYDPSRLSALAPRNRWMRFATHALRREGFTAQPMEL